MSYVLESGCPTHGGSDEKSRRDQPCLKVRLNEGKKLFHRFHNFKPQRVIRRPFNRIIPQVLVDLGSLRGLIYSTDKTGCGRQQNYIHLMKNPPRLVCNTSGRQLYILGGKYRITPRGIEG